MWKEEFNGVFDWVAFACIILLTIIGCGGASYLAFYETTLLLEILKVIFSILLVAIIIATPLAWIEYLLEDHK